jgi:hypothetical protein
MGITHPDLDIYINQVMKKCGQCLQFNPMKRVFNPARSVHARRPWYHIQLDLIGPLPESKGCRYLLIAVDVFSSYVYLTALESKAASAVSEALVVLLLSVVHPRSSKPTTVVNLRTILSNPFSKQQLLNYASMPHTINNQMVRLNAMLVFSSPFSTSSSIKPEAILPVGVNSPKQSNSTSTLVPTVSMVYLLSTSSTLTTLTNVSVAISPSTISSFLFPNGTPNKTPLQQSKMKLPLFSKPKNQSPVLASTTPQSQL